MKAALHILPIVALAALTGCRQDMHDQPKIQAFEENNFFLDRRGTRPQVEGTVARGRLFEENAFYTGKQAGELVSIVPIEVDATLLDRGRERYQIFCTPCHDPLGYGGGIVVQRGMVRPASFHIDRLREVADGYFFDVITHGFGAMYDYADRVPPKDRWAIVAYIRALQLSQDARVSDVPEDELAALDGEGS